MSIHKLSKKETMEFLKTSLKFYRSELKKNPDNTFYKEKIKNTTESIKELKAEIRDLKSKIT